MSDYIDQWISGFPQGSATGGNLTARVVEALGHIPPVEQMLEVSQIPKGVPQLYRTPSLVTHGVVLSIIKGDNLQHQAEEFKQKPRVAVEETYKLYEIVKDCLTVKTDDIVQQVAVDLSDKKRQNVQSQILRYMILGECQTRLGEKISRPEKNIEDVYFDVLLDVARVIFEDRWNTANNLPWLADDQSKTSNIYRGWEKRAGDLGNYMGGAVGRAIAAGVTSVLSPIVKLPDEVSRAIAFLFGVTCRKAAETAMQAEIKHNPDHFPEIPDEK